MCYVKRKVQTVCVVPTDAPLGPDQFILVETSRTTFCQLHTLKSIFNVCQYFENIPFFILARFGKGRGIDGFYSIIDSLGDACILLVWSFCGIAE